VAVREDSAIGNLESRPWRVDLSLAAQDRCVFQGLGRILRLGFVSEKKVGVDLDPGIFRDLRRIERPTEGKVN
jgi:hypothetical protein